MPVQEAPQPQTESRQTNKERLKEITDSIEKGIKELFQSDKYKQYLTTMSRFHHYSVNNQMLIYMQMPNATHVAGFNKWHDQFGRNVVKGQRGIKIIAPTPFKKKTVTGLNMGMLISFSSVMGLPSASSRGSLVSGSSFSCSIFFLKGVGAMILMPRWPFTTFRPN